MIDFGKQENYRPDPSVCWRVPPAISGWFRENRVMG